MVQKFQKSESQICEFLGVWNIRARIWKNEGTFGANIYMGINTKGPRLLYANIKEIHKQTPGRGMQTSLDF